MDKRNVANKAHLVEPIVRHRVQDSLFYKQYLHLTNEQSILPIITEHVHYIGGGDSSNRPSPFLCCLVRLLEIEPLADIIHLYLDQNGYKAFKYLTALALLYCRMVLDADGFYSIHDKYITDYRKVRVRDKNPLFAADGTPVHYRVLHMDVWVDLLLREERVVDLKLPFHKRLQREPAVDLLGSESGAESGGNQSSEDYVSDSD